MSAMLDTADVDLQFGMQTRGNEILGDFDRLRREDPVHWSEQSRCWVLTRHQDVSALFMARLPVRHGGRIETFAFAALSERERAERVPNLSKYVPQWIINLDGEAHQRIRSLLVHAFGRPVVGRVREYARERVESLLSQCVQRHSFEFNEEFARVVTGYVLFRLIGMPESLFPSLKDWATAIVEGLGSTTPSFEKLEKSEWAVRQMNEAVLIELEKRRVAPQEELLTSLLQATVDGARLTVDELLAQMQIIIVAGHDTTANTMTLGVEALSRNPDALHYMSDHPEEITTCVSELQRYVAMSTGQALLATDDFELSGKKIKRGDVVVGLIAAADRDPLKFTDPGTLDLKRNNKDSLVFAPGPHFCIGHVLAKMQLAEFFLALARRVRSIEILDDTLRFMPVFSFRGLYYLNVRFNAR
jgi:pimeloyl-[acyl-carrier protein] synthase